MPSPGTRHHGGLIEALGADHGLVCLVGAGGKKSTIYRIVSAHAGRVAITATVHTPPFRKRLAAETIVAPGDELEALVADARDPRIVAYASPSDKKSRLAGVDPERVARIHELCGFDLTLVKADGARLRWIKAPAAHEPALPPHCRTLIPLVSVRAVGAPLDHGIGHRPETIAALTGAVLGQPISPGQVARLMAHEEGGMKHADRAERVIPVINMVDDAEQRYAARLIAEQILRESAVPERVVLTRMVAEDPVVEVVRR